MNILKNSKKLIPFVIFVAALATLSSCNRGMGCPTFSIENGVKVMVAQLPPLIKQQ